MSDYYDREGTKITLEQWCVLFEDQRYKRIVISEWADLRVSTVWLGLDHNFHEGGSPLIFETMIFGGDHDEDCWRWQTEEEARKGHDVIVHNLRAGTYPFAMEEV